MSITYPPPSVDHHGAAAKVSTEPLKGQVLEWKTKFGRGDPESVGKKMGQWEDHEEKILLYTVYRISTHKHIYIYTCTLKLYVYIHIYICT